MLPNDVPDSHVDLLSSAFTATLTTIAADGTPQSTAVWYLVDRDGNLKGSTTTDRSKYKNMRRNPRATLFIIEPTNPFHTLEIRAQATLEPDPGKVMVRALADHYGTTTEMIDDPGSERITFILTPHRVVASG